MRGGIKEEAGVRVGEVVSSGKMKKKMNKDKSWKGYIIMSSIKKRMVKVKFKVRVRLGPGYKCDGPL